MEGENKHRTQQKLTFYENGWMENNWDLWGLLADSGPIV